MTSKPSLAVGSNQGPVVSNTTPFINLVGVGLLDLLPGLYGTVWIPAAVSAEYVAGSNPADPDLATLSWLKIAPTAPIEPAIPAQLGAGEAAALSLAIAENARAIILDEAFGRRVAHSLGLPVVGTLGVLLAAKRAGLLPAVTPVMEEMIRQGRRFSPRLQAQILKAAGE